MKDATNFIEIRSLSSGIISRISKSVNSLNQEDKSTCSARIKPKAREIHTNNINSWPTAETHDRTSSIDIQQVHKSSSNSISVDHDRCGSESMNSGNDASHEEGRDQDFDHEVECGFELAWIKLNYSVAPNVFENPRWGRVNKIFHKYPRTILKGVSGGVRSGQFVALMGPSGAGKTCLLECIAGIRRTGLKGQLSIRGRKKAQLVIVPQYDNFLPEFTVEEIISYGSRMKNSIDADHIAIVDKVISQLGLRGCRKNKIRKCSGGQQKRVAIAQELVSKPNILILDEPSSGLDSSICYQTMKVLRQVLDESLKSDEPMAIITTIHQPSAKVFQMFDIVYVLGRTGHFAYSGPPTEVVQTIKQTTGLDCPKYSNPADYIIELISYDYGEEPVDLLIENEMRKSKEFEEDFEARYRQFLAKPSYHSHFDPIHCKDIWNLTQSTKLSMDNKAQDQPSDRFNQHEADSKASSQNAGNSSKESDDKELDEELKSINLSNTPGCAAEPTDEHRKVINSVSGTSLAAAAARDGIIDFAKSSYNTRVARPYVIYKRNDIEDLHVATARDDSKHPFFWHLYLHMHRSIRQSLRDPILNRMRVSFHIIFSILIIILYGREAAKSRGCPFVPGLSLEITDPNHEDIVDMADNVGFIFVSMMMIAYVSLMTMTLTFPLEIRTISVEYRNGWYGILSFFLGKSLGDLPFIISYPIIFCMVVYFGTNQALDEVWRPVYFTLLVVLNALNCQTFGLMMGSIFVNSITAATFIGPVTTIPWYLFSGFPKRITELPSPLRKISTYMYTRHIFEALLATIFGYDRCNCTGWVEEFHRLKDAETSRLGQLVSAENLIGLDYYDDLDKMQRLTYDSSGSSFNNLATDENTNDNVIEAWDRWEQPDLFKIMDRNKRNDDIFAFGLDYEPSCPTNYSSYIEQEFHLTEHSLMDGILKAAVTLFILRLVTFFIVAYKIKTRELG